MRFFAFAGLGLVLLFAGLVGFSETEYFRSLARDYLIETVDSALYAKLSVGAIEGNIFSGWKISDISLRTSSGPLLSVPSITVRYNLFSLPWKKIDIGEVTLFAPSITLTKGASGLWNFQGLARDTTASPPSKAEFDWRILVRSFSLVSAQVSVWDSTTAFASGGEFFDARHLLVGNLDAHLEADIGPAFKRITIDNFSFRNYMDGVSLQALSGEISTRRNGAAVKNLAVRTDRSALLLSARFDGADPLSDTAFTDLASRSFGIDLTATALDSRDLKHFLPSLSFLGGAPSLRLIANGSLRRLTIPVLELRASKTALAFRGELRDIDRGADLVMDISSDESVVHGADIALLVPGLGLPDYSGIGTATFRSLRYTGTPLKFHAELDLESEAGAVTGKADMDMTKADIDYAYEIRTRELDLAKLLQQPLLSSSLTLRATLRGSGFTIGRMTADAEVSADSTRFQRYYTDSLSASLRVRPDTLRLDAHAQLGRSMLTIGAGMRFERDSVTGFGLRLDARNLDLAKALDKDELESNLTFVLSADGDGLSLGSASAHAKFALEPSTFRGIKLDADTVVLLLEQQNPAQRTLSLDTRYATLAVRGAFDIPRFVADISERADSIAAGLRDYRLGQNDTEPAGVASQKPQQPRGRMNAAMRIPLDTSRYMDARYTLRFKDTDRLARHIGAEVFMLQGGIDGTIRGSAASMDIAGDLQISDAYFIDSTLDAMAAGIRVEFSVKRLTRSEPFKSLIFDTRITTQEIAYGGFLAHSIGAKIGIVAGEPRFQFRGRMDTSLSVAVEGHARAHDGMYDVSLPVLQCVWLQRAWNNADTVRLQLTANELRIPALELRHNGTSARLTGSRTFNGENDISLHVEGLRLSEVDSLFAESNGNIERGSFSGDAVIDAHIRGSDSIPELAAELYVANLGYDRMVFETFRAEATYTPSVLEVFSELHAPRSEARRRPVFSMSGSLPIDISFTSKRTLDVVGDANLHLSMRDFPLALTEKFLGLFSPLEGTANAELDVQGRADDFRYDGRLTVENARGRFTMNNMYYGITLKVEPRGNAIHVRELTIRNEATDWSRGAMTAAGTITMDGLRVRDIAMNVDGRLKVLRKESRSALKAVYGDLYITTGKQPLRYVANDRTADLTGNLEVLEGNLTYASDNGEKAGQGPANIRYVDVDDLSKEKATSLSSARRTAGGSLMGRAVDVSRSDSTRVPSAGIATALQYDLSISTGGMLRIVMPFSTISQMELNAVLNIERLRVNSALGTGKFVGIVNLGADSYYKMFGKQFSASGSLEFIGDPQNPDLNLRAVYSDYHTDRISGDRRKVYVVITITGNRVQPKISWDMRWDSQESQSRPRAGDVQSDAFSFILLGLFTDELTSSDRGRIIDQADEIANAVASSMASSAASEFLSKAGLQGVLQRVEVSGLGTQDARVKATSGIGRVLLTYDGKINNLGSSDLSFEIPMNMLFPDLGIGNMVIQGTRKTSTTGIETSTTAQETVVYEVKLLYRFSF